MVLQIKKLGFYADGNFHEALEILVSQEYVKSCIITHAGPCVMSWRQDFRSVNPGIRIVKGQIHKVLL